MEDINTDLNARFPCREMQIRLLCRFIVSAVEDEMIVPNLLLYGPPTTGKSAIIVKLLETIRNIHFSIVNCIECYTPRLLFGRILADFLNCIVLDEACDTMLDFVSMLKKIVVENDKITTGLYIIVLKGCERLSDRQLQVFSYLSESVKCSRLCVVYISHSLHYNFHCIPTSLKIYFPRYNMDELLTILSIDHPPEHPIQFYKNFLNIFLSSFYSTRRSLGDLQYLVKVVFTQYIKPIEAGKLKHEDQSSLYNQITPFLKQTLENAHAMCSGSVTKQNNSNLWTGKTCRTLLDLPYFSRHMLIAAYLASFIPPKRDKHLFMKNSSKKKKRKNLQQHETANAFVGPKPFPFNRLMAIFFAILQEPCNITANILSQISSLVELRLLTATSDENIDKPQYKCVADFDCVFNIAKTVGFNLEDYLPNKIVR